ncbi:MAG: hypothetical protein A4E53_01713 [Pelotomaculum sp. PtaB.Bin104]|nr:MAG: hypothetical protein A4E53_01713 [Pelotomaculum sp. PtaB.Bin104]
MENNPKDLNQIKHQLSPEAQRSIEPTESFNKSEAINQVYKIQEQYMAKAKASGDQGKIREADRFCRNLEREISFYRNSK